VTDAIVLTDKQRAELLRVFGAFAPVVQRVDVYGSRARGDAHPGSDIDLIVDGPVKLDTLLRIAGALEDSYLSIFADVTAYNRLEPGRFADQIARDAKTLFDNKDLAQAPPFIPVDGLVEWYRPVAA
jgi:predicted nucleotidyltransferase